MEKMLKKNNLTFIRVGAAIVLLALVAYVIGLNFFGSEGGQKEIEDSQLTTQSESRSEELFVQSSNSSGRVNENLPVMPIKIGNLTIQAEIASTSEQWAIGLSNRDSLGAENGMLFVFQNEGTHRFWMKETNIPLDMIWFNADRKIIYIEEDVQPESYPETFGPEEPTALYVLEVEAGSVKRHGISIGNTFRIEEEY